MRGLTPRHQCRPKNGTRHSASLPFSVLSGRSSFEGAEIGTGATEGEADIDAAVDECAAFGEVHEGDRGQRAIGLAWRKQFPFVRAQEVLFGGNEAKSERIVGSIAFVAVDPDECCAGFEAEVVAELVTIAVDVGAIVGKPSEHVEVGAIAEGGIVKPVAAAGMMIG